MSRRSIMRLTRLVAWAGLMGGICSNVYAQLDRPAIAVRPTGEADVVAPGECGSVNYLWATPGSSWGDVDIAEAYGASPAIAVRSDGEADIALQANNELMYFWATPGSAWHSATIAGAGSTFSPPAMVVRPTGEADIVAQGPNNSLRYYHATPGSSWRSSTIAGAGTTFSAPAIALRPTGQLTCVGELCYPVDEAEIVVEGPNNSLRYYHATPGSSWTSTTIAGPGTTFSAPAIAARSTDPAGELDVVAEGRDNSLMYYWAASSGSSWGAFEIADAGSTFSAPAIAVRSTDPVGEADIVAAGPDNSLMYYHATPGSAWGASAIIGPNAAAATGAPSIVVRSTDPEGEADIVATYDGEVYYFHATPGSAWGEAVLTVVGCPQ